ncbi:MAG: hypothetical protein H7Y19_15740 [Luteimonas sp.]|nr:hypothetical protein [Luteimonas sp.]
MTRFTMFAAGMALLCCAARAQGAGVEGHCEHESRTAAFVDGAAWAVVDDDTGQATGERMLVFSTYDLDSDALWRAKPHDREDAFREQDSGPGESARLQLTLDADGAIVTQQYLWLSPGNNLSRSGSQIGTYAGTPGARDRVAGRYTFSDEEDDPRCDLRFDIAVLGDPAKAPPLPGKPLPAGGGEPGRAYLANNDALIAGDLDALARLLPPDRAAQLAQARTQPEFAAQLAFMQGLTARDVRITGGRQDGDRAWLDFTATEGGEPRAGSAEMRREGERWFIVSESTRPPD